MEGETQELFPTVEWASATGVSFVTVSALKKLLKLSLSTEVPFSFPLAVAAVLPCTPRASVMLFGWNKKQWDQCVCWEGRLSVGLAVVRGQGSWEPKMSR